MPAELLRDLGAIAGIGGIALGIFFPLGRQVIARNLFPQLNARQAYNLLSRIILFAFLLGISGIIAYVYVSSIPQSQSIPSPTPITSTLYIDRVEQVSNSQPNAPQLSLDITLRNPSQDPINVTQMALYFNYAEQASLLLVQDATELTGDYQITVTGMKSASTIITDGTAYAATVVPPDEGHDDWVIETPISQSLSAGQIDKYRVTLVSNFAGITLSQLKTVKIKIIYNNVHEVFSNSIPLSQQLSAT